MKFRNYKVVVTFGNGSSSTLTVRHGSASAARFVTHRAYPNALTITVEVLP